MGTLDTDEVPKNTLSFEILKGNRLYLHLREVLSISTHKSVLPYGIVVERSPIRSFAADCLPISIIF